MTTEREELEEKISLAEDYARLKTENLIIQNENKRLKRKIKSGKNPTLFDKLVDKKNLLLAGVYGAELYFIGTKIHDYALSKATDWFMGYDHLLGQSKHKAPAVMGHIIGDGAIGAFLGFVTGAAIGGVASYTYNLVKESDPAPLESTFISAVTVGAFAAAGGLLGAEFTDATGIVLGSYLGSAIGIGYTVKEGTFMN